MTRQKVDVIPASVRSVQNGGQLKSQTNIRVAAYCRVSTGDESQLMLWVSGMLVCALGAGLMLRRKKEN